MPAIALITRDSLLFSTIRTSLRGHSVDWVRPGEHLVESLTRLQPDLILLDTNEDNLSVIAVDQLQELSNAPVLALAFPERFGRKWSSNVQGVLNKPFKPDDLEDSVARLLWMSGRTTRSNESVRVPKGSDAEEQHQQSRLDLAP